MRANGLPHSFLTRFVRIILAEVHPPNQDADGENCLSGTQREAAALASEPSHFLLGRDHGGHWIVQESRGLCGGLFTSKEAAIRYAKFESADQAGEIRLAPDFVELKFFSA
jgi:hypothetical protein